MTTLGGIVLTGLISPSFPSPLGGFAQKMVETARFRIAAMSEALAAARWLALRRGKTEQSLEISRAAAGLSDTAAVRPKATSLPQVIFWAKPPRGEGECIHAPGSFGAF